MTLNNRMKVLEAGFKVFRQDPRSRIITCATTKGGWSRVGIYHTLSLHKKTWAKIMAGPMNIDD